jgi:plastocyanin
MRLVLVLSAILTAAPPATDLTGVVRLGDKPLANAIVWLDAPNAPKAPARAVINQTQLAFQPEVLAIRVGTVVKFPNNDTVLHNVFSFRDGKKFDLGIYPVGASKEVTFDNVGLSRIFCNIHAKMAAYVLAVDSPYFAVSDANGLFTIRGVPEGAQTWNAWRANGTDLKGSVTVASGSRLEIRWP